MRVLITGSAGFIAGYVAEQLLADGHEVVGLDNYDKYGPVERSHDNHRGYEFVQGDAKDRALVRTLLEGCDHFIAMAAKIGGIAYFHKFAYDLLAENERITAAAFDAAINAFQHGRLKKITVISSSMVFENAHQLPSKEGDQRQCPPPSSTYGFQKLACEYFAQGALEQYGLRYTILRPFNCVGVGESRARQGADVPSGNIKLALSHVVPDLILKVLRGQDPLHILGSGRQLRHYTYGGDLARGIIMSLEHPSAINNDFNLSTAQATTVLELAEKIWGKVHEGRKPFSCVHDDPFDYDVQVRSPDVTKAKEVLGFEATTTLDEMLDEVIDWIRGQEETVGFA